MLIALESAGPDFERVWVTGGHDDFLHAAHQWEATHARCGAARSTEHLWVDEHPADLDGVDDDGIRRAWFHCDGCARRQLVLGPAAGGDLPPIFPRIQ